MNAAFLFDLLKEKPTPPSEPNVLTAVQVGRYHPE
jgi:hypothetical protein